MGMKRVVFSIVIIAPSLPFSQVTTEVHRPGRFFFFS
jgi:hypothetical protein